MVFYAVFISISVILQQPMHLSMLPWSSFNQYSAQYYFPSYWLLSHITIIETMDSSERLLNPVPKTIIIPWKEYWPSWGSNQRPPVLKSETLPTELRSLVLWIHNAIMTTLVWMMHLAPFASH